MKKLITIILVAVMMVTLLAGCVDTPTEVSREPVDVKYTKAYDSVVTDYEYRYNIFHGGFVMVPNVRTVHHAEEWSIQYRITYGNGEQKTMWCKCTEAEYNLVKGELITGGDG